jgi:4,5-DOPA dioxygenase extradiol
MERSNFLKLMGGTISLGAVGSVSVLNSLMDTLPETDTKMPVLFVGHGSPMNGIEDNSFSQYWKKLASEIEKPKAVLCVSAHWLTKGTYITAMEKPPTIHDFGGFPQALFDVEYPAPGDPKLAEETAKLFTTTTVGLDHEWGMDHGTWTIVRHMYQDADIPVLQLSIDYNQAPQYHYDLAKNLQALRKKGVLIMGSGNMVHNLGMVAWDKLNEPFGFDWAIEMNTIFKQKIEANDHAALIAYEKLNAASKLAIPTPDHYYPLLYTLALKEEKDAISFFNDEPMAGSLTMTSVKIG